MTSCQEAPRVDAIAVRVIGEALIDIVVSPDGTVREHVGGSPANVAVGLARLGHRTELATWIAPDDHGRRIAELLASEGVQRALGSTGARRTSTAMATLDASGTARYRFDLTWDAPPSHGDQRSGVHRHTGSIAATLPPGADVVLEEIRATQPTSTISYDPNIRPALMGSPEQVHSRIETLVALSDVVKASEEDLSWLYPGIPPHDVLADWASMGPAIVVCTQGADAVIVAVGQTQHSYPARSAEVADTVGAGDSFMAGLISGLLDLGLLGGSAARRRLHKAALSDVEPAISRALACAAVTVSRPGANPPTRNEI